MTPVRLQLSRKPGFSLQAWSRSTNGLPAVNCARPSLFGNPFVIGRDGDRASCVEMHRNLFLTGDAQLNVPVNYTTQMSWLRRAIREFPRLRGHNLACWCDPPAKGEPDLCHCATYLEAAAALQVAP